MKITVIGPTYPFRGGIAHYTSLLVQHLRQRHQVRLISYLKQYPKWLYPGNTAMDPSPDSSALRVENERVLAPLNPLTWWRAFRMIERDRPDLLLLQWWTPFWSPMLFFLTRMMKRHQMTTHTIFLCHHIIAPDGGIFDWYLARRILWRGHAFIVMSEEDFALLRRALPKVRIAGTTHPPYDVFSHAPLPREQARAQLGLAHDEPVLLFFGFVRRYKGLRNLIRALAKVREQLPARLLVVGEFWEDERPYRELVRQLDLESAVEFNNAYVPNEKMTVYFSAADAVVLPYLEATQSGVAQVALGFETPVIATAVGGLAETIVDGQNGLIVRPGDNDALSEAIVRYFREQLRQPFERTIRETMETASWMPLVHLIEDLYAEVALPAPVPLESEMASPRVL
jgi:glycosyltransferase involved in cell wall biosynthesis